MGVQPELSQPEALEAALIARQVSTREVLARPAAAGHVLQGLSVRQEPRVAQVARRVNTKDRQVKEAVAHAQLEHSAQEGRRLVRRVQLALPANTSRPLASPLRTPYAQIVRRGSIKHRRDIPDRHAEHVQRANSV